MRILPHFIRSDRPAGHGCQSPARNGWKRGETGLRHEESCGGITQLTEMSFFCLEYQNGIDDQRTSFIVEITMFSSER